MIEKKFIQNKFNRLNAHKRFSSIIVKFYHSY